MSSSKRKVTRTSSVKIPCVARTQVYTEFVPTTVFRTKTTQSLKTLVSYSTKINNITQQVVRTQVLTEFVPTTVFRTNTVYRTQKPSSAKSAIISTRNVTSVITATVSKSKSGGIFSAIKNLG